MPQPTEAHRTLERLAGTWVGDEEMPPSSWAPEGVRATGRSVARVALGGFAVVADYRQERDGQVTFEGHGVYTYDPSEECYVQHWFDCTGSPPELFKGTFEEGLLTLRSRGPRGHARVTSDLSVEGRMVTRMETSPDGETWSLAFEGRYVREA
ncbi:MAG: DUF1579 family protein [Gemmatimonadota bacterium]